jgi:hypothetical protein
MSNAPDADKNLPDGGYEIKLIEPTDPPRDMEGSSWHRYVISLGESRISGYQCGTLKAVTESVHDIVARLNERRFGKRGRVHLDMSGGGAKTAEKSNR